MIRTPEAVAGYPNLVLNQEALLELDLLAVARQGSGIGVAGVGDLARYRLGYLSGVATIKNFLDQAGLAAEAAPSTASLRLMLEAGRFELALILLPRYLQAAPDFGTVCGPALRTFRSYHVLNVRHAGLIPGLDRILAAMKADGRFQRLLMGP